MFFPIAGLDSTMIILQAWNTQTNQELSLSGPAGQVYAMIVGNGLLFAGTQVIIWSRFVFFIWNFLFNV